MSENEERKQILLFIHGKGGVYKRVEDYRDIEEATSVDSVQIYKHMNILVDQGFVTFRTFGGNIYLTDKGKEFVREAQEE